MQTSLKISFAQISLAPQKVQVAQILGASSPPFLESLPWLLKRPSRLTCPDRIPGVDILSSCFTTPFFEFFSPVSFLPLAEQFQFRSLLPSTSQLRPDPVLPPSRHTQRINIPPYFYSF